MHINKIYMNTTFQPTLLIIMSIAGCFTLIEALPSLMNLQWMASMFSCI